MNTTTQANEKPAQPVDLPVDLRDYFAAKAMQQMVNAISTAPKFTDACAAQAADCEMSIADYVAARSYDWADAMLKARQP